MLKPKKKDLNQPVTLGVFMEYIDFFSNNVAMKKDIDAATEKILASNNQVLKQDKTRSIQHNKGSGPLPESGVRFFEGGEHVRYTGA